MSDQSDSPDFAELDALLDQALQLGGAERDSFLESLEPGVRDKVRDLLSLSESMTLTQLASRATSRLASIAGQGEDDDSPAAGRWRLRRELGSGGMGQVFYATRQGEAGAEDSGYTQQAAIKVLWSHRAEPEVRSRFFRERRILASLDHPGIARFLDGGFLADGRPWFAMAYVDGEDVLEYVQGRSLDERLALFIEICSAVAYAHERLIVHRDIKPQNVLVDRNGHAQLLDFGVASVLDDAEQGLTGVRGSPMTLQYASPEQVSGQIVSVASDVYQLGLMLYQLLADVPPYDLRERSLQQSIRIINERMPPAPSTHNAEVGRDLDAITLKALDKSPKARYRSALGLAEDVQRYREGRPVQAIPHSRWYVARRFVRRHALPVAVVGFSAIALTTATVISLQLANEARDQARRSAATQQILSDVFQKADPFGDGGANVTLAEALIQAQPGIAERVSSDPVLAWEVNHTLAEIYESLGLVEQEAQAYQAVMRAADEVDDGRGYHGLVGIAGYGGTLARTDPTEAVEFFSRHLPASPQDEAEVAPWLSAQYSYIGALDRMRSFDEMSNQAKAMQDVVDRFNISAPRTRGRLSQMLANVARRQGDGEAEDQHWQDAVAYMRASENASALAVTLNNRAIFLGRSGRYAESEEAFLEAIAIYEAAEYADASLAGVLRGYGGLLFRMGNHREALDTTRRALALLDAPSEAYARFVAQLSLVRYMIVTGDLAEALEMTIAATNAALEEFEADSGVPGRMLGVFAKQLLFGDQNQYAGRALGFTEACRDESAIYAVLAPMEDPAENEARAAIWGAVVGAAEKARREELSQAELDAAIATYQSRIPPFFDVLDHWRVLAALTESADSLVMPGELLARYQELNTLKQEVGSLMLAEYAADIDRLASIFQLQWETPNKCASPGT